MGTESAAEQYRTLMGLEEAEHVDGISEDDDGTPDEEDPPAKSAKKTTSSKSK